jgi:hypothetical protein
MEYWSTGVMVVLFFNDINKLNMSWNRKAVCLVSEDAKHVKTHYKLTYYTLSFFS